MHSVGNAGAGSRNGLTMYQQAMGTRDSRSKGGKGRGAGEDIIGRYSTAKERVNELLGLVGRR
jgi:hypothetical protein